MKNKRKSLQCRRCQLRTVHESDGYRTAFCLYHQNEIDMGFIKEMEEHFEKDYRAKGMSDEAIEMRLRCRNFIQD